MLWANPILPTEPTLTPSPNEARAHHSSQTIAAIGTNYESSAMTNTRGYPTGASSDGMSDLLLDPAKFANEKTSMETATHEEHHSNPDQPSSSTQTLALAQIHTRSVSSPRHTTDFETTLESSPIKATSNLSVIWQDDHGANEAESTELVARR